MEKLNSQLNDLRMKYREIFSQSLNAIVEQIMSRKPENPCANCAKQGCDKEIDILNKFDDDCPYKKWQKDVLEFFEKEFVDDFARNWGKIQLYRGKFSCNGCATCCKLASSEFSYEELLEKAKSGDKFASQFTSVFVPYKTVEEARNVYPEYIDLLKAKSETVYFYYCPKNNPDGRCSDYENRPDICRDFPDNPLSMLPVKCGFCEWKKEIEPTALMLHSMLEIISYYKEKIQELI